jgi:hypothetical protein
MMNKVRLFMFVAALGLLGAQFAVPLNGQASPIPAGASAATTGPHLSSEIVINAVDNEKYLPSVAYNSKHQEYLVVWSTRWGGGLICCREIRAQRVSAQGKLLGSEFTVYENTTKDSGQPSVAYDPVNDRYLVTFLFAASGTGTSTDWDLYGRLIPWNGPSASLAAFPIITWNTSQWNPKVVYAGGIQKEFLVVWTNTYAGNTSPAYVSVKRIPTSGSGFSATADLSFFGSVPYVDPDVSYNLARNEYLVVWDKWTTTGHDIWGVRITGNAVQLGGGPFVIAGWPDNEESPSVAACNVADQYLVTWQSDVGSGGATYDIYGYLVNGNGNLDTVFWIDNTTSPEIASSVACNKSGSQYLVVYQQRYTNLRYGITGRLVFPDHSMEAAFVVIPPGGAADRTNPAVAGGNSSYLVAWEHQRGGTSYQDIHGRIVTPHVVFLPLVLRK